MKDRSTIISHLQTLRTWAAVNPKYGKGLDIDDCKQAVGYIDDALELINAQEKPETNAELAHRMATGLDDFLALRQRILDALKEAAKSHPGKSYEGEIELYLHFPGIYEDVDGVDQAHIKGHFYLIGPYRHYDWHGLSIKEATERAAKDIDKWIVEAQKEDCDYDE